MSRGEITTLPRVNTSSHGHWLMLAGGCDIHYSENIVTRLAEFAPISPQLNDERERQHRA